ncbi:uncharacterized protein LOC128551895 [Mercenaria mercenaria]|uniref:uncharacterized protein LOC128551895 n=1 Tax=Mercenaria mercenaria TaxID=6596 RepID=UPI00234F53A6|nr:uncharacterized protein LOC128551895 [Mercenaria mercenaria]
METGSFPDSWGRSIICPVHKSGSTGNPGNYRDISITNVTYMIFSGVVNKRLYDWAEMNSKIDESQAGFRHGYSAVDNIFPLQAMQTVATAVKLRRYVLSEYWYGAEGVDIEDT